MDLSLPSLKQQKISQSLFQSIIPEDVVANDDIFILYSIQDQKGIVEYLFRKCIEDFKGKRNIHIMSIDEYKDYEINTITEVEVEDTGDSGFKAWEFFDQLGPYRDDTILVYSHMLDSTQSFLTEYCAGYQNIVCTADIQITGRGRKTNCWSSPIGCLMFSYKSALYNSEFVGMMQYLEALVVCEALEEMKGVKGVDFNIKWPNDVYVNKYQKICGILCQSLFSNGVFDITSGIGINVSNRKPTICVEELLKEKTGEILHLSRAELLGRYIRIWNRCYPRFCREGFKPYIDGYYGKWLHTNQAVNVMNDNGTMDSVIIKGIGENGYLIAVDANGNKIELLPDGNTFNFLEGLISKKM